MPRGSRLKPWPVDRPRNWVADVNRLMDEEALKVLRRSAGRGVLLGTDPWKTRIADRLGLEITLRPRGRPRKRRQKSSFSGLTFSGLGVACGRPRSDSYENPREAPP